MSTVKLDPETLDGLALERVMYWLLALRVTPATRRAPWAGASPAPTRGHLARNEICVAACDGR